MLSLLTTRWALQSKSTGDSLYVKITQNEKARLRDGCKFAMEILLYHWQALLDQSTIDPCYLKGKVENLSQAFTHIETIALRHPGWDPSQIHFLKGWSTAVQSWCFTVQVWTLGCICECTYMCTQLFTLIHAKSTRRPRNFIRRYLYYAIFIGAPVKSDVSLHKCRLEDIYECVLS